MKPSLRTGSTNFSGRFFKKALQENATPYGLRMRLRAYEKNHA